LNGDGISYTQMEYEYALLKEIPIIGFLHKKPGEITVEKSEKDPVLVQKLNQFRELVQRKMCRYWESASDLGSQVSRSLVKLIKDKPRDGWVKGTFLPSEDTTKEILELKKLVEALKLELEKAKTIAPEGTERLSQGEDIISLEFRFDAHGKVWQISPSTQYYNSSVDCTWNENFAEISPLMIDEASELSIREKVNNLIYKKRFYELKEKLESQSRIPKDFKIDDNNFHTIKIQFRALGLITESVKKRSIHDKGTYWTLTPYGDTVMTRLRAIRK
jgi:hypothetical protein